MQDLDGDPLPGYHVITQGPVPGLPPVEAGANARFNAIYRNEAAWEQVYNPVAFQPLEIRVQVCKLLGTGECLGISNVVVVQLGDYASGSLGYVTCTLNWENWE